MSQNLTPAQQEGLRQISDLARVHNLSPGQVKRALSVNIKTDKGGRQASKSEMVLRLFAYLGGTLIFAGLGVFINMAWDDLSSFSRVLITLGTGFTAYIAGLIFLADRRYEKAATPAHIFAFFLQPTGLFVLLEEYFDGGDAAMGALLVFGALFVQQALTFAKFRRASIAFFSLFYLLGLVAAATEYYMIDRGLSALALGIFIFFITIEMQRRDDFKDLSPFFYIISTGLFYSGLYYFIGRTIFDPMGLSITLSMLLFAVRSESKTLYVLSMLYLCGYFCGGPGGGWPSWDFHNEMAFIFTGASLSLAGHWLQQRTNYISLFPLWLFLGTSLSLGGFYSLVHQTPLEALYVGAAAAGIFMALQIRSRAVLAASVLSLIGFIVTFSAEHFADTIGWPVLLILLGFATLAAGFLFARLSGQIKSARE